MNSKKPLTVLITGATGHLGAAIIAELLKNRKYKMKLLLRSPEKIDRFIELDDAFEGLKQSKNYFKGDIRKPEDIKKALEGVDLVIHTCHSHEYWHGGEFLYDVNVHGAQNLIEQINMAPRVKKVVLIGSYSAHVAGKVPSIKSYMEEVKAASPRENSSKSKRLIQSLFEEACSQNSWDLTVVSPPYMIGPYQINPAIFTALFHLVHFRPLSFAPIGGLNLADVRDVAKITVDSLEQENGKINRKLVTGENVSYKEMFQISNKTVNNKSKVHTIPSFLIKLLPKTHLFGDFGKKALVAKKYLEKNSDNRKMIPLKDSIKAQIDFAIKTEYFKSSFHIYKWIYRRYFKKQGKSMEATQ